MYWPKFEEMGPFWHDKTTVLQVMPKEILSTSQSKGKIMPIDTFHVIDDAVAVIRQNGVFKQTKVYRRANEVFVSVSGGYVRLMSHGATSVPSISWLDLDAKGVAPCEKGSHRAGQPLWSATYRCDKTIDIEEAIAGTQEKTAPKNTPGKNKGKGFGLYKENDKKA